MTNPPPPSAIGREPGWHLNRRWSLADMDRIKVLALEHAPARFIADQMGTTEAEILGLAVRNGFSVRAGREAAQ